MNSFVVNEYDDEHQTTVAPCFYQKELNLRAKTVSVALWDTAGQERFAAMARLYFRDAQAAFVVYDVSEEGSFEKAKQWISDLRQNALESIVIALIGNKVDLIRRAISPKVICSTHL